jgi:HSP20 family molecular chaperone IbpA
MLTKETTAKPKEREPERALHQYSFRIALPQNVQIEIVEAKVKDGDYVTIPKASATSEV